MNAEQILFFQMLKSYPRLEKYWDPITLEFSDKEAEDEMQHLNHGEATALRCLIGIWAGSCTAPMAKVTITEVACMKRDAREPIVEWLKNPFWP